MAWVFAVPCVGVGEVAASGAGAVPAEDGFVCGGWPAVVVCSSDAFVESWVAGVDASCVDALCGVVLVCFGWECADYPGGDVWCVGDVLFELFAFAVGFGLVFAWVVMADGASGVDGELVPVDDEVAFVGVLGYPGCFA